jgi:hypothetical protein
MSNQILNHSNLPEYIAAIAELPMLLTDEPFATPNHALLYNSLRFQYKAVSTWLKTLLLAEALAPEAVETDMKYFQPTAEFSADGLRFIVEVYIRSDDCIIRAFHSPAALWFAIEYLGSIRLLQIMGIDGSTPNPVGKRALTNKLIKKIDNLSNFLRPSHGLEPPKDTEDDSPGAMLRMLCHAPSVVVHLEARRLALADPVFEGAHYQPYLRKMKRLLNKLRNTKELPLAWVDEYGELVFTEKNHRPPQQEGKSRLGRRKNQL